MVPYIFERNISCHKQAIWGSRYEGFALIIHEAREPFLGKIPGTRAYESYGMNKNKQIHR